MRDNNEKIVNQIDCTQVTQKTYMMNKLQACTAYRFQVQVVTRGYLQRKESGWKTSNAQTPTQGMNFHQTIISKMTVFIVFFDKTKVDHV